MALRELRRRPRARVGAGECGRALSHMPSACTSSGGLEETARETTRTSTKSRRSAADISSPGWPASDGFWTSDALFLRICCGDGRSEEHVSRNQAIPTIGPLVGPDHSIRGISRSVFASRHGRTCDRQTPRVVRAPPPDRSPGLRWLARQVSAKSERFDLGASMHSLENGSSQGNSSNAPVRSRLPRSVAWTPYFSSQNTSAAKTTVSEPDFLPSRLPRRPSPVQIRAHPHHAAVNPRVVALRGYSGPRLPPWAHVDARSTRRRPVRARKWLGSDASAR